jgi:hypothetical protein
MDTDLTGSATFIDAFETALRGQLGSQGAAYAFMRSVPYVHGRSLADELIARMSTTRNETVRLGMATLARAYADAPACTPAEAGRIRQALARRPVHRDPATRSASSAPVPCWIGWSGSGPTRSAPRCTGCCGGEATSSPSALLPAACGPEPARR